MGTPVGGERAYHRFVRQRLVSPDGARDKPDGDLGSPQTPVAAFAQVPPLLGSPEPQTPPHASPVTLESIASLLDKKFDEKLAPLTNQVQAMQENVGKLEGAVGSIQEEVKVLKVEVNERVDMTELRVAKLEELFKSHSGSSSEPIRGQIQKLEEQIAALKLGPQRPVSTPPHDHTDVIVTAVIGGLKALSSVDEARSWISNQLWYAYGPQPEKAYCKGDFTGVAFAKFQNQFDRDEAVKLLKQAKPQESDNAGWAKEDQPINTRTCTSLLFGLRWLLTSEEWGYDKKDYFIDTENLTFKVGGKDGMAVLQASVT